VIYCHRYPPDDELVETEIATFDEFWQCHTLDMRAPIRQTRDSGSPSAGIADFVVTRTRLFLALLRKRRNP
jgi:hypothetical protein